MISQRYKGNQIENKSLYSNTIFLPFSGPSSSTKSALECASRNTARCGVDERPSHNELGSIEMKILATKNPTKTPVSSGVRYLRLVILRTPNKQYLKLEFITKF